MQILQIINTNFYNIAKQQQQNQEMVINLNEEQRSD